MEQQKVEKSLQKINKSNKKTNPPMVRLVKRAKRVNILDDCMKLLSKSISLFQAGKLSAIDTKTICYLIQTFVGVFKSKMELNDIDEIIESRLYTEMRTLVISYREFILGLLAEAGIPDEKYESYRKNFTIKTNNVENKLMEMVNNVKKEVKSRRWIDLKNEKDSDIRLGKALAMISKYLDSSQKYKIIEELSKELCIR
ncbi:MAG: hypothetical protein FJW56_01105 [Actinobacteria bacterium]|nr:hypothetical protein [Actinomycetota bacterium]